MEIVVIYVFFFVSIEFFYVSCSELDNIEEIKDELFVFKMCK